MLFGERTRHWVLRSVKRCCEAAGVRVVSPHGLRGTHAKMAREVGVSGVLLAQAMGHESEPTTTEHCAPRAAVETQPLTASQAWCIKSGPPRIEQNRSVSKQLKSRLFSAMLVPLRPRT
jgi:hypothetical protein